MSTVSPLMPQQPTNTGTQQRPLSRMARVWETEYGKDIWQLSELGIKDRQLARISFEGIPQSWLKALAKRWGRWRFSSGLGAGSVAIGTRAVTVFGRFLIDAVPAAQGLADINRELLERYLADLHAQYSGTVTHRMLVGQLNLFFTTIRQHRWDDSLPSTVTLYSEDIPKQGTLLPRGACQPVCVSSWSNCCS